MRGDRAVILGCAILFAAIALPTTRAVKLFAQRTSATDLEVGGELAGVPRGETRYVARAELLAMPHVSFAVRGDPNFSGPTQIKGVLLEELAHELGATPAGDLVVAICDDKYRANYPRDYLTAHHPVLVLEVSGKPPSGWPKSGEGFDMGPYMISHEEFEAAFKILSHTEEAQIPWGVVRLEFRDEKTVFGAIAPRGSHANDADVQAGYRIAEQNCFRCHNMGSEGGQKSGIPWTLIAAVAENSRDLFVAYVRDPKSKSPLAAMPGNPNYDDETLRALAAYFRTLYGAEQP
ncbi:MAG TPA: c-type cytochrome [Candidatus Acidoferrales bacterium]|nr:c-type cytochrome [Candidatus Acidoferrales bacterium]